jgi:hypothetical protein
MKAHTTLFLVGALCFAAPVLADTTNVDDLAAQSGLSKQEVRMLIGARTPYPAYRTSYERARKQLVAAIGQNGYEKLLSAAREQSRKEPESSAG